MRGRRSRVLVVIGRVWRAEPNPFLVAAVYAATERQNANCRSGPGVV